MKQPGSLTFHSQGPSSTRLEEWFESVKTELLVRNPFRGSEYFKRFAAGTLTRSVLWTLTASWQAQGKHLLHAWTALLRNPATAGSEL